VLPVALVAASVLVLRWRRERQPLGSGAVA
jgi:hypothetical protein